MDAGINNVIYMELYSGPKMANGRCGKTIDTGTIDRGSTVYKAQKKVTEETIGKTQKESPYCFHLAKLRMVVVVPRHYSVTVSD